MLFPDGIPVLKFPDSHRFLLPAVLSFFPLHVQSGVAPALPSHAEQTSRLPGTPAHSLSHQHHDRKQYNCHDSRCLYSNAGTQAFFSSGSKCMQKYVHRQKRQRIAVIRMISLRRTAAIHIPGTAANGKNGHCIFLRIQPVWLPCMHPLT